MRNLWQRMALGLSFVMLTSNAMTVHAANDIIIISNVLLNTPVIGIVNGPVQNTAKSFTFGEDMTQSSDYMSGVYYQRLNDVSLTGDYRTDVISIARSQLGYHEGDNEYEYHGENHAGTNNYTEYGRFLDSIGKIWCSEFATWCIRMAGVPASLVNNSKGANANTYTKKSSAGYYDWSQTKWSGGAYDPQKGDLILWVWDGFEGIYAPTTSLSHTTILESYADDGDKVTFSVVHGNSSDRVRESDYMVSRADGKLTDGSGYVGYFVAPDYEGKVNKYRVSFDTRGGEMVSTVKTVVKGGYYGVLPIPAKEDDVFLGWMDEEGEAVDMYTIFDYSEDMELTAKWESSKESDEKIEITPIGDLTGDGVVGMGDVVKLARAVAGTVSLTAAEEAAADVTGDGRIGMGDVVKLARIVAGRT